MLWQGFLYVSAYTKVNFTQHSSHLRLSIHCVHIFTAKGVEVCRRGYKEFCILICNSIVSAVAMVQCQPCRRFFQNVLHVQALVCRYFAQYVGVVKRNGTRKMDG